MFNRSSSTDLEVSAGTESLSDIAAEDGSAKRGIGLNAVERVLDLSDHGFG